MFHLDNTSGVPEMPEPKEQQSITPKWFGESVEQGGISWPGADWFNTVQAELLNLLKAAGISPDKKSFNQLSKAIPVLGDGVIRKDLMSSEEGQGSWLVRYQKNTVGDELNTLQFSKYIPKIYYGAFFENGTNAINIATSHDGITFSDPIRLTNGADGLLRARDPSLIFYNGLWLMATTANTPGSVDLVIYTSPDLITWTSNPIRLNGDFAICSDTEAWDSGSIPAKYLWAGEFFINPKTNKLHLIISILIGNDNYFGTYLCELESLDNLTFTIPVRVSVNEDDGSVNRYSRIDAAIAFDDINNRYLMAVKRETFGFIDIFYSTVLEGPYYYLNSITGLTSTGASSGYFRKSSIEAPSIYKLKNSNTWVVSFDPNDTFDGILYVTTSDDFSSLSVPRSLRLAKLRHGSVMTGDNLTPQAIKNLEDCRNGMSGFSVVKNRPLNFIQIKENGSLIPRSDTVYWADQSVNVTLVTPSSLSGNVDYPRNFYFCMRSSSRLVRLRVTGAVAGGNWDIGWGVNNDRLIEFFYESLSNVYRSEAAGALSYTQTRLTVDAGTNSINASDITWAPRHAKTYVILDADGTVTINALPDMPVGTYFNVVIQSGLGSFVGLVLKAGTNANHLGTPAEWAYKGGASGFDGALIRIEKGSDRWFATKP
ncbi:TPA: hypothetical protein QDZ66_003454 [Pluralibacter gergoviae]|nr:hypothetical protein [Pluralibacter gergoviae]